MLLVLGLCACGNKEDTMTPVNSAMNIGPQEEIAPDTEMETNTTGVTDTTGVRSNNNDNADTIPVQGNNMYNSDADEETVEIMMVNNNLVVRCCE